MNQLSYGHEPRLDTILMAEKALKYCGEYPTKKNPSKAYPKNTIPNIRADTQLSGKLKQNRHFPQTNHLDFPRHP
jgi:hypothetical protein